MTGSTMSGTSITAKNLVESRLSPTKAIYRQVIPSGVPWIHEIRPVACEYALSDPNNKTSKATATCLSPSALHMASSIDVKEKEILSHQADPTQRGLRTFSLPANRSDGKY